MVTFNPRLRAGTGRTHPCKAKSSALKIKWFGSFHGRGGRVLTVLVAGGSCCSGGSATTLKVVVNKSWQLYRQMFFWRRNQRDAKSSRYRRVRTVTSILVGDRQKNAPCRKACQQSGWNSGRLRETPTILQ